MQHREKKYKGSFSAKYYLNKLVYWESFQEIGVAIAREKQLKAGSRQKKLDVINAFNPEWLDLFESIKDIIDPFQ